MPAAVERTVMHNRLVNPGATALLYAIVAQPCFATPANAATPVVFKIWNNRPSPSPGCMTRTRGKTPGG